MNIKHMEYFAIVAQCGSINKAAQSLYISQPYLSHIIRDMEQDIGATLFCRTKQGVVLTPEGARFLEHSTTILKEMELLKKLSKKAAPQESRFSLSMTKFSHTMESFIHLCRHEQHLESFSYRMNEGTVTEVIEEVASGVAEVGVIHYASTMESEIKTALVQKNMVCREIVRLIPNIVLSKNHALIQQNKEVTLYSLQEYGFRFRF